ncbi:helix-turn-helix domain-containing protein [Geobacillus subterraneus]
MLNITPTFGEIERGKKRLRADLASRIAGIFGVTVDYLLGLSDDPNGNASATSTPEKHNPYALTSKVPVI